MSDYPVTESPEFRATMRQLVPSDRGAADVFNPLYQQLLDNDNYLNQKLAVRNIALKAGSWSASYPYTQDVGLNVTAGDNINIIGVCIPDGADLATVKALNKAAGYLMHNPDGVDDGQVTFKAYKKPTVDLEIAIEGVQ